VHKFKAPARMVYLPAGADWYDFNSGERHAGGQTLDAKVTLSRMPLYVRAGSIVPVGPDIQYSAEKPGRTDHTARVHGQRRLVRSLRG
jgi:alpha-D-xyloside xylohydrolase